MRKIRGAEERPTREKSRRRSAAPSLRRRSLQLQRKEGSEGLISSKYGWEQLLSDSSSRHPTVYKHVSWEGFRLDPTSSHGVNDEGGWQKVLLFRHPWPCGAREFFPGWCLKSKKLGIIISNFNIPNFMFYCSFINSQDIENFTYIFSLWDCESKKMRFAMVWVGLNYINNK